MHFSDIQAAAPTREQLAAEYAAICTLLDAGALHDALDAWDQARRRFDSWTALVHLRFAQDTRDAARRADRAVADELQPAATGLDTALRQRLLAGDRDALERRAGRHPVRLWECDVTTFRPEIAADLEQEASLAAQYTELLAAAEIAFRGQVLNLAGLGPHAESPDRDTRHAAEQARWTFFAANAPRLDELFDQLVRLRHTMARKLGDATYTPLAYRLLRRVDYGPDDVARYRDQVAEHVVPLVARLLERRRQQQGWDRLRFWDEALVDPAGNPGPAGDHDFLLAQAQTMFDRLDPRLGGFYRMMAQGRFLDLDNRPGKQGGGFCTSFPSVGVPFIFANFNGTQADINVFTHEMGHAFQSWESRHQPGIDSLSPTFEAAEINSMGLEFLAYPHIGLLVGDRDAERFRRMHLIASLAFLPYGVCVDHFQHEVYARPDATPAERHAIWQRLERRYMPWTDYGDLEHPAMGGRWQAKPHIYGSPFYYIDYTLALCCAMQLWARARHDPQGALATYVALCGRGGSAPFRQLVAEAGLASPFDPGALADVVLEATRALGL